MNITRQLLCTLLLLAGLGWQPMAAAQSDEYSKEGADTCLGCHDEETAAYSASAIFKSRHAHRGDKRSPFGAGGLQCEACHGPGAAHARNKKAASINTFKPDSKFSLEQRNRLQACHEGMSRTLACRAHERAKMACIRCNKIKQRRPVLASQEAAGLPSCQSSKRADSTRPPRTPCARQQGAGLQRAHGSAARDAGQNNPDQTCTRACDNAAVLGNMRRGRDCSCAIARRLRAPGAVDQEPAAVVPAMPQRDRSPVGGTHRRRLARSRRRRLDLPGRWELHQLPHAGARLEPSLRSKADAMNGGATGPDPTHRPVGPLASTHRVRMRT